MRIIFTGFLSTTSECGQGRGLAALETWASVLIAKNPEASPGSVSLSKVSVTGEKGKFGKYRRIHTHLRGY